VIAAGPSRGRHGPYGHGAAARHGVDPLPAQADDVKICSLDPPRLAAHGSTLGLGRRLGDLAAPLDGRCRHDLAACAGAVSGSGMPPGRGLESDMMAARRRHLERMAATLDEWSGQIADLEAKARSAGGEQHLLIGRRIAALCERRAAYRAQMDATRDTSAGMLRGMRKDARRIAAEFRRIYIQSASRFASAARPSGGAPGGSGRPPDAPERQPHFDPDGSRPPIVTA
jgi:hypothetical protein